MIIDFWFGHLFYGVEIIFAPNISHVLVHACVYAYYFMFSASKSSMQFIFDRKFLLFIMLYMSVFTHLDILLVF